MLKRKMFRDIRKNLSQFITIFLMIFLGVMVYSGIRSYMTGMKETADAFYNEYNLQDLNIVGTNFNNAEFQKIKEIDGVKNAERKLTVMGTLENQEDRTIEINFIESNEISRFYITEGSGFDKNKSGVWIDHDFANNNNLKVGDTLNIKYDEEILKEEIIGFINVPDHVYSVKDESEAYPNHTDYGFCYLSTKEFPRDYIIKQIMLKMNIKDKNMMEQLVPDFNVEDYVTFTNVMVEVQDETKIGDIKKNIESNLKNVLAVVESKDTSSYKVYQGEIDEGQTYAGIFTGLFLFIAILSVVTTMTRVVSKQRVQIGTLKAVRI